MTSPAWIVLDTDVVRHTVQGRLDVGIDLGRLQRARGNHPVSLSEVACVELMDDLIKGNVTFDAWQRTVPALDAVLDADIPVVPNGRGLGAMLGLVSIEFDLSQSQRTAWEILRGARKLNDLRHGRRFEIDGVVRVFKRLKLPVLFAEVEASWVERFRKIDDNFGPVRSDDRDEMRQRVRTILGEDLVRVPELELVVCATVERLIQHGRGYRPKLNDALDFEHLFMVGLPGIVCSSDRRARNFARELRAPGSERFMSPSDLLAFLEPDGPEPAGRQCRKEST